MSRAGVDGGPSSPLHDQLLCPPSRLQPSARCIHLSYHDGEHYNSVHTLETSSSPKKSQARTVPAAGPSTFHVSALQRACLSQSQQKQSQDVPAVHCSPSRADQSVMRGSDCDHLQEVSPYSQLSADMNRWSVRPSVHLCPSLPLTVLPSMCPSARASLRCSSNHRSVNPSLRQSLPLPSLPPSFPPLVSLTSSFELEGESYSGFRNAYNAAPSHHAPPRGAEDAASSRSERRGCG